VDPNAKPQQAAQPAAARVGVPDVVPAAGVDQRIEENVSENGINSHDMAFGTRLSEQPWNRGSKGSGETGLREGVPEAMAESLLAISLERGRELSANGREGPDAGLLHTRC
jgi:hypothetical protein